MHRSSSVPNEIRARLIHWYWYMKYHVHSTDLVLKSTTTIDTKYCAFAITSCVILNGSIVLSLSHHV